MTQGRAKMLTMAEAAEAAGLSYETFRRYRARGQVPLPDGYFGRTPWWKATTIRAWRKGRPGSGYRSDLHDAPDS